MAVLRAQSVVKSYRQGTNRVMALRGVSFDVDAGEFIAIMGASGSGKSTLLHLCAGLTQADSGHVEIDGIDLGSLNDRELTLFRRRRIGLIFQSFNLIPTLSARENVALPLILDGRNAKSDLDKIDTLLDYLGLHQRASHKPDALSGGEQQRVAIGRALVTDPAVILADEPTGNLDSENSRLVCELLRDLSRNQNRTILMVTHEHDVAAYTQRTITLRDGKMIDE